MAEIAAAERKLEGEIPVRDGVERIRHGPVEAESGGRHLPVDGKGGAGQRRRPEGAFVHPHAGIGEAAPVAPEHLDIGQHVMTPGHRLCDLEVGEARHQRGPPPPRPGRESARWSASTPASAASHCPRTHMRKIGRDLIVARPRGMKPSRGFADEVLQARLDVHVDVLEVGAEGEFSGLDL